MIIIMLILAILAIVATINCVFLTEEWYYSNELCITEGQDGILWLNDWYEGQQYVDFIAFAEINGGDWK